MQQFFFVPVTDVARSRKCVPIRSLKWHNQRVKKTNDLGSRLSPRSWVQKALRFKDSREWDGHLGIHVQINISWIHYYRTYGIHYTVNTDVCKIYELLTISLGTKLFPICQIDYIETFQWLYVTCLYWLLIKSRIDFNMLLLTYKVLRETEIITFCGKAFSSLSRYRMLTLSLSF